MRVLILGISAICCLLLAATYHIMGNDDSAAFNMTVAIFTTMMIKEWD